VWVGAGVVGHRLASDRARLGGSSKVQDLLECTSLAQGNQVCTRIRELSRTCRVRASPSFFCTLIITLNILPARTRFSAVRSVQ